MIVIEEELPPNLPNLPPALIWPDTWKDSRAWSIRATNAQNQFYLNNAGRKYNCAENYEVIEAKILTDAFGNVPPRKRSLAAKVNFWYTKIQRHIAIKIRKMMQKYSKSEMVYLNVVYIMAYIDETTETAFPVFYFKNADDEDRYIDLQSRIYENWDDYIKNNVFDPSLCCYPIDGHYAQIQGTDQPLFDEKINPSLAIYESPACRLGNSLIRWSKTGLCYASYALMGASLVASISSANWITKISKLKGFSTKIEVIRPYINKSQKFYTYVNAASTIAFSMMSISDRWNHDESIITEISLIVSTVVSMMSDYINKKIVTVGLRKKELGTATYDDLSPMTRFFLNLFSLSRCVTSVISVMTVIATMLYKESCTAEDYFNLSSSFFTCYGTLTSPLTAKKFFEQIQMEYRMEQMKDIVTKLHKKENTTEEIVTSVASGAAIAGGFANKFEKDNKVSDSQQNNENTSTDEATHVRGGSNFVSKSEDDNYVVQKFQHNEKIDEYSSSANDIFVKKDSGKDITFLEVIQNAGKSVEKVATVVTDGVAFATALSTKLQKNNGSQNTSNITGSVAGRFADDGADVATSPSNRWMDSNINKQYNESEFDKKSNDIEEYQIEMKREVSMACYNEFPDVILPPIIKKNPPNNIPGSREPGRQGDFYESVEEETIRRRDELARNIIRNRNDIAGSAAFDYYQQNFVIAFMGTENEHVMNQQLVRMMEYADDIRMLFCEIALTETSLDIRLGILLVNGQLNIDGEAFARTNNKVSKDADYRLLQKIDEEKKGNKYDRNTKAHWIDKNDESDREKLMWETKNYDEKEKELRKKQEEMRNSDAYKKTTKEKQQIMENKMNKEMREAKEQFIKNVGIFTTNKKIGQYRHTFEVQIEDLRVLIMDRFGVPLEELQVGNTRPFQNLSVSEYHRLMQQFTKNPSQEMIQATLILAQKLNMTNVEGIAACHQIILNEFKESGEKDFLKRFNKQSDNLANIVATETKILLDEAENSLSKSTKAVVRRYDLRLEDQDRRTVAAIAVAHANEKTKNEKASLKRKQEIVKKSVESVNENRKNAELVISQDAKRWVPRYKRDDENPKEHDEL